MLVLKITKKLDGNYPPFFYLRRLGKAEETPDLMNEENIRRYLATNHYHWLQRENTYTWDTLCGLWVNFHPHTSAATPEGDDDSERLEKYLDTEDFRIKLQDLIALGQTADGIKLFTQEPGRYTLPNGPNFDIKRSCVIEYAYTGGSWIALTGFSFQVTVTRTFDELMPAFWRSTIKEYQAIAPYRESLSPLLQKHLTYMEEVIEMESDPSER
jgi:hypothetical protein